MARTGWLVAALLLAAWVVRDLRPDASLSAQSPSGPTPTLRTEFIPNPGQLVEGGTNLGSYVVPDGRRLVITDITAEDTSQVRIFVHGFEHLRVTPANGHVGLRSGLTAPAGAAVETTSGGMAHWFGYLY